ncbi:alpha-galactosidase [Bacillus sp. SB49]|uniref:alpha-galactosidase n=1 Tax=Bacillaceae TaxID=186817 RepID=UPI0002A5136D|nr:MULTISPECIES: alpha-galactosidase [Bacillaceae]ELK49111.1 alpha-galactosidase [Halobacillus sp. BAB-2008]QHT48095.1 alpha-galactosidase [Bacillus sp. SB49]
MLIHIHEAEKQFHLTNGKISYIFHVMRNGQLGHLYYGKAIRDRSGFARFQDYETVAPSSTHVYEGELGFSMETILHEATAYGKGDFREPAVKLEAADGSYVSDFRFDRYHLEKGKAKLPGLPATFAEEEEAETLTITLKDEPSGVEWDLSYTIFRDHPVLSRSSILRNDGTEKVKVERLMSLTVDLPDSAYDMVHLAGAWSRERHIEERPLRPGIQSIGTSRGASSHQHNPFLALKRKGATEFAGEVLGCQFVYSGNFLGEVEVDHYDRTRVSMGINPDTFTWHLESGASFQAPEAVLVYSENGMNGMSQALHALHHGHLIAPRWLEKERPILINNWEATYFDFDEAKLDAFAEEAKDLGIELFVLDDGWFGKRNDDTTSLGDWFVDEAKLPNGIGALAKQVKAKGLQFGLWFEPEMVSPVSDLIKEHPEWVVGVPGRHQTLERNQKVLDYANPEVVDYLFSRMDSIIKETKLDYIKWDMNRNITEPFSPHLEHQGEFFHRYILGVYDLYERLTSAHPDVLFESCAGGGGRFDAGLLYYAPQAWASDDTDAAERLKIQYGTSIAYPLSSIGSHISAVPNHQTSRETPMKFRNDVAVFGTFGYELDPSGLTEEEKLEVRRQIKEFQNVRRLIQTGTFHRLLSPFEGGETAWIVVSEDGTKALAGWYRQTYHPNPKQDQVLKLTGLDPDAAYRVTGQDTVYYGDECMYRGLPLPVEFNGANAPQAERAGDFQSQLFLIEKVEE